VAVAAAEEVVEVVVAAVERPRPGRLVQTVGVLVAAGAGAGRPSRWAWRPRRSGVPAWSPATLPP
jgi:hypothetical protein